MNKNNSSASESTYNQTDLYIPNKRSTVPTLPPIPLPRMKTETPPSDEQPEGKGTTPSNMAPKI